MATITIKKAFLDTLPIGADTLTFNFTAGSTKDLVINVSDSTHDITTHDIASATVDSLQVHVLTNDAANLTSIEIKWKKNTDASYDPANQYGPTPNEYYTLPALTSGTVYDINIIATWSDATTKEITIQGTTL